MNVADLGQFNEVLDSRRLQYGGALLTAAVDLEGGSPRLIAATLIFQQKAKQRDTDHKYPGLHLVRKWLTLGDAEGKAQAVFQPVPNSKFAFGGYEFKMEGSGWGYERSSIEMPFLDRPATEFIVRAGTAYGPNTLLVAPGAPTYPNAREAIMEWFDRWEEPGNWLGLTIVLPEFRGRIEDVVLSGHSVRVESEVHRSGKAQFRLDYYGRAGRKTKKGTAAIANKIVDIDLGFSPRVILVCLLTKKGEIIDWRSADLREGARPPGVSIETPVLELEMQIRGGEGLTVEFKREVKEGNWERITQSIVAFANALGGTILIGVSDEGETLGWDSTFPSPDDLAKAVSQWVEPGLECTLERRTLRGKTLVVIEVP